MNGYTTESEMGRGDGEGKGGVERAIPVPSLATGEEPSLAFNGERDIYVSAQTEKFLRLADWLVTRGPDDGRPASHIPNAKHHV